MLGRTHLLAGIALGFFLLLIFPQNLLIATLSFFLCLFGSILPDIDTKSSFIGRHFKIVGFLFRHIVFFHSIFALLLFTVPLYLIFKSGLPALAFSVGFLSHLFLDILTREGIQIYPFDLRVRGFVKVGGFLEQIFFFCLILFLVFLLLFIF